MSDENEWIGRAEMADKLNVCERTVTRKANRGELQRKDNPSGGGKVYKIGPSNSDLRQVSGEGRIPFVFNTVGAGQKPRIQDEWADLFPDQPCTALLMSVVQSWSSKPDFTLSASISDFTNELKVFRAGRVKNSVRSAEARGYLEAIGGQLYKSGDYCAEIVYKFRIVSAVRDLGELGWDPEPILESSNGGDAQPEKVAQEGERPQNDGYVYVLSNESLDCVKVGYTNRTPEERCEELTGQTGLPTPFQVEGALRCFNPEEVEQEAHKRLDSYRVSDSREFFDLRPSNAMALIEEVAVEMNSKVGGAS